MDSFSLFSRLSEDEYNLLRYRYDIATSKSVFGETIIWHVGMGAGLYSEIGSMLESVLWCCDKHLYFVLYADDANFAESGHGWETFFEPFCEINHSILNHYGNYRYKHYRRIGRIAVPNLLIKRYLIPFVIKKTQKCRYLTQDVFNSVSSKIYHSSHIENQIFGINGEMLKEYAKLAPLCLRYNEKTANNILIEIAKVHLPDKYVSIQIRGGDKTKELENIKDAPYCLSLLENEMSEIKSVFIFTDDYRNVEYIKNKHRDWNIYTLCNEDEKGYCNYDFQKLDWERKYGEIIKLFAMVEICIQSSVHIGCCLAAVNNYIRSARYITGGEYREYILGEVRKKSWKNLLKRIVDL